MKDPDTAARHHFVLVHGSWMGSWCWDALADRLRSRGHVVDTPDLPGRSRTAATPPFTLDDYAAVVEACVRAADRPVILLGHSFGGIVATQAAERVSDDVHTLVYLAAFVPRPGAGLAELASIPEFASSLALKHAVNDAVEGTQTLPADVAPQVLFNQVATPLAERLSARLVPESLGPLTSTPVVTAAGAGSVDRVYIECTHDHAIPLNAQRAMAAAAGINAVSTIDSDHSPFVSQLDSRVDHLDLLGYPTP
ncbi:pimeloyl-ACP methyl ester carboxylesterase [Rhodococcus sp. 27YEA15]|uniref:alpha/beta hydrolase n=1 Tax=Rhodococcus sp. 27YEA15 TaxID=3156259 RepID=UPI003C7B8C50